MTDHDGLLANRARGADGNPAAGCEEAGPGRRCDGVLLFAMRDRHHAFTLDLETVLGCLRIAEHEGDLPELPDEWWNRVLTRYNVPVGE